MKKLHITISKKEQNYPIVLGRNILQNVTEVFPIDHYGKIFILTDQTVGPLFLNQLLAALPKQIDKLILPAGESAKTLENIQKIWTEMRAAQCDRKSLVINLGGGVICDMGGFAASTYMRGVDFINIPTTLLAQVDASVGGKTGIDFMGIKNFIGTITQPKAVIIDVETLSALPKRAFVAGFAEIIKHGLIADKNYFEKVTKMKPRDFTQDELIDIIKGSCEIKKKIVQDDETEKNQRKLLNFGHTIGHAFEALSLETDNPLLHGEAVSIGMVAEAKLSELSGLLSANDVITIKTTLHAAGLPITITKQSTQKIMGKIKLDKKNEKGTINFTLLKQIGQAITNQQSVTHDMIEEALAYVSE